MTTLTQTYDPAVYKLVPTVALIGSQHGPIPADLPGVVTHSGEAVAWIPLDLISKLCVKFQRSYDVFTPCNSTEEDRQNYDRNLYDLTPVYTHADSAEVSALRQRVGGIVG